MPALGRSCCGTLGRPLDGSADAEDAVQEVFMLVARGIGGYRWEGRVASRLYAISTRHLLRASTRSADRATVALELIDEALITDHEAMTEAEGRLLEQELHLSCLLGSLVGVASERRLVYHLGKRLGVPDTVGAEVVQAAPALYRKRLQRARRSVAVAAGGSVDVASTPSDPVLERGVRELDALARLGELHRAHARPGIPDGALGAVRAVAPMLAA